MTRSRFCAVPLSEIPSATPSARDKALWKPVRAHLGIRAFGTNAYIATSDGQQLIEEHTEPAGSENLGTSGGHEELYLVVGGHAEFAIGGEAVDAPAGTLVFVRDPDVPRSAVARSAGTTVIAFGGAPGEAYAVSPWEQRELREHR